MSLWINRTICDVLSEMRKCHETHNYAYLPGLIEEAQSMANRMEAALSDVKQIAEVSERWHECHDKEKAMDLLEKHRKKMEKAKEDGKTES